MAPQYIMSEINSRFDILHRHELPRVSKKESSGRTLLTNVEAWRKVATFFHNREEVIRGESIGRKWRNRLPAVRYEIGRVARYTRDND